MSARDDIVGVLMRTPQPRTVAEIGYHAPHLTLHEIGAILEGMKADGQLARGVTPAGVAAYVLVPAARTALWREDSGLPGPAMAGALLVGLATLAVLALVVGVYVAKFTLAFVKAVFVL